MKHQQKELREEASQLHQVIHNQEQQLWDKLQRAQRKLSERKRQSQEKLFSSRYAALYKCNNIVAIHVRQQAIIKGRVSLSHLPSM